MTVAQFSPREISIRPINLDSDADMEQLNALDSACDEKLYGFPSTTTLEERRAILAPSSYYENHRWVAEVQGQILGIVLVSLPLKENLGGLNFHLSVHPEVEGRGLEEALTRHALDEAIRPSGRTHITYYGFLMQDEDKNDPTLPIKGIYRGHARVPRAWPLTHPQSAQPCPLARVRTPHRQIITMNSAVNPAMTKVKEELGYQPVWEEICYQN